MKIDLSGSFVPLAFSYVDVEASAQLHVSGRTFDGIFLQPGYLIRNADSAFALPDRLAGPELLVGVQWLRRSGWNLALAAGGGIDLAMGKLFPNAVCRIGYAFLK